MRSKPPFDSPFMKSGYIILLKSILVLLAISSTVLACFWMYLAAFEGHKDWLDGMVRSQAAVLEALKEIETVADDGDSPLLPYEATLQKLADSHVRFREFGETGEFLIGYRQDGGFRMKVTNRSGIEHIPGRFLFEGSDLAEAMRRALRGEWGIAVVKDYRGESVLAAYSPLKNGLGVVAKVDMAEIRTPYLWAGIIFSGLCLILVLAGTLVLLRVALPAYADMKSTRERLEVALQASDVGIWTWDIRYNRIFLDERSGKAFGLIQDQDLTYDSLSTCFHPEDAARVDDAFRCSETDGNQLVCEFRVLVEEGKTRHVSVVGRIVKDPDGHSRLMTGVVLDRTDQREMEHELEKEHATLRTLIDNLPDEIFAKDRDCRFMLVNRAHMERLDILDPQTAIGRRLQDLRVRGFAKKYKDDDLQVLQTGQPIVNKEEMGLGKDGMPLTLLTTKVPLRDKDQNIIGLVGISKDISDRKMGEVKLKLAISKLRKTEENLQKANSELQRSNLELEQFAYVASHDLQEPLRMVASYTELLAKRYQGQLDEKADKYIHYAVDGARRMQLLIQDLLSFSRVTSNAGSLLTVDCGSAIAAALENLQGIIEESGAIIDYPAAMPNVNADLPQLAQLFQNLIGNAIKYRNDEPPEIKVRCVRDGQNWKISVSDNGIGFDPKYNDRIFIIFKRLHNHSQYSGTGIGLAVCKRIVERHGGLIRAESQPGEGSTFTFTLPVAATRSNSKAHDRHLVESH